VEKYTKYSGRENEASKQTHLGTVTEIQARGNSDVN
jgi:hypothetical protein